MIGWLSPAEIARRASLDDVGPVIEALHQTGLAENRAHSVEAWEWAQRTVPNVITSEQTRDEFGALLVSLWDQVTEDRGEWSTTWRCAKRIRVYSPAAVRAVERELEAQYREAAQ